MVSIIPSNELRDTFCNTLTNDQKQSICDSIMRYNIDKSYRSIFLQYVDEPSSHQKPDIVGSGNAYECRNITVEDPETEKPMFWCNARRFRKTKPGEFGDEQGFFCAASDLERGRVYAFRPPTKESQKVTPLAEKDDCF